MRVHVDPGLCACGLCVDRCPEAFAWDQNEKAATIGNPIPAGSIACCSSSVERGDGVASPSDQIDALRRLSQETRMTMRY